MQRPLLQNRIKGIQKADGRAFVWTNYRHWRPRIFKCAAPYFDRAVLEWLKVNPPRYFVDDILDWLDDAIWHVKRQRVNMKTVLADALTQEFDFIRGFHGCRAPSTESYRTQGILPSDSTWLKAEAVRLFGDSNHIQEVFAELSRKGDDYEGFNRGKTYFCLHLKDFMEGCGHYLLYGSEYLLCVAVRIGHKETLRKNGRATVIECNVPISDIPRDYIEEICGMILCEIASKFCTGESEFDGGCFHIKVPLQPQNIVTFHHPTQIPNPHNFHIPED